MKSRDFIKGALPHISLDSFFAPSVVEHQDLNALRHHRDTAKKLLESADRKEGEEGFKLLKKVKWHFAKIDLLLEKTAPGSMHRMTEKKERQNMNLKANEFNTENDFILIGSKADREKSIGEKGKMFDEVMCVKGDEKREKNKVMRRMGR